MVILLRRASIGVALLLPFAMGLGARGGEPTDNQEPLLAPRPEDAIKLAEELAEKLPKDTQQLVDLLCADDKRFSLAMYKLGSGLNSGEIGDLPDKARLFDRCLSSESSGRSAGIARLLTNCPLDENLLGAAVRHLQAFGAKPRIGCLVYLAKYQPKRVDQYFEETPLKDVPQDIARLFSEHPVIAKKRTIYLKEVLDDYDSWVQKNSAGTYPRSQEIVDNGLYIAAAVSSQYAREDIVAGKLRAVHANLLAAVGGFESFHALYRYYLANQTEETARVLACCTSQSAIATILDGDPSSSGALFVRAVMGVDAARELGGGRKAILQQWGRQFLDYVVPLKETARVRARLLSPAAEKSHVKGAQ